MWWKINRDLKNIETLDVTETFTVVYGFMSSQQQEKAKNNFNKRASVYFCKFQAQLPEVVTLNRRELNKEKKAVIVRPPNIYLQ